MNRDKFLLSQSDEHFIRFVQDVQQRYTFSASMIDTSNNIIITIEGRDLMIPRTELYRRYEAFKQSALLYPEWVSKTAGYITHEVEKWYKRWH